MRKVLEQRSQVRECLVECRNIHVGLFEKIASQTIDDRVRHLVHDDVVREAGENRLARQVAAGILAVGDKIPKEDAVRVGAIEGVRRLHRVGI